MRRVWLLILTGVASVALVTPVVVQGARDRLRVEFHDGLRASVRALGIDRYAAWTDVAVLPRFDGVLLQQVTLGAADGRPLLTLPVATCHDVTLADGFLTHITCEGDGATLDLDALAATAGVTSLARADLGRQTADVDIGWAVDDTSRTLSLVSRLGLLGVAALGCDLSVDGVDLAALRELHASRPSFGDVGLLWNPVGWVRAMQGASGATMRALQDVALRDAGCGLTDDGLRAALRANPELAMYVAGSARFAVAGFDPTGGDAITRFMDQGGTLRVGTKATAPVPLFAPGSATWAPGPLLEAPLQATAFGVQHRPDPGGG